MRITTNKPVVFSSFASLLLAFSGALAASIPSSDLQSGSTIEVVSFDKQGTVLSQGNLETESNWLYLKLPEQAVSKLGEMKNMELKLKNAPPSLKIELNGKIRNLDHALGIDVSRKDTAKYINQNVEMTLVNTDTGESYTFTQRVIGNSK